MDCLIDHAYFDCQNRITVFSAQFIPVYQCFKHSILWLFSFNRARQKSVSGRLRRLIFVTIGHKNWELFFFVVIELNKMLMTSQQEKTNDINNACASIHALFVDLVIVGNLFEATHFFYIFMIGYPIIYNLLVVNHVLLACLQP